MGDRLFLLGDFEACDSGLTTTPSDNGGTALTDSNSNSVPDIGIGTGSVFVKDAADLAVSGVAEWDGTLDFYLCGPSATQISTCTSSTGWL